MVRIELGKIETPDRKEEIRQLHKRLSFITEKWKIMSPKPEFKITMDPNGRAWLYMNKKLIHFMLLEYNGAIQTMEISMKEDPDSTIPKWFMDL